MAKGPVRKGKSDGPPKKKGLVKVVLEKSAKPSNNFVIQELAKAAFFPKAKVVAAATANAAFVANPAITNMISGITIPANIPLAAPVQLSSVFDQSQVPAGTPLVQQWKNILYNFGHATDWSKGRIGDFVHDCGSLTTSMVPSMLDFVGAFPNGAALRANVAAYPGNIPLIKREFHALRRNRFTPRLVSTDPASLAAETQRLIGLGITNIVLDAQFGNIFKSGFGRGMTLINSIASEIDGASKVGPRSLTPYGITPVNDYTPFVIPNFYEDSEHRLEITGLLRQVTINFGGNAASVQCGGGISVNAICTLLGLAPPRGSGVAGNPVQLVAGANLGAFQSNHIAFVKTITDWGQNAYGLLLSYLAINCLLITNDEFNLDLAAAMGAPMVIRTPYAGAEYIEVWQFDPRAQALTAAEIATINAAVLAAVPPQAIIADFKQRRARTIDCMMQQGVPTEIITEFHNQMRLASIELDAIIVQLGLPPVDPYVFRSLLTLTVDQYIIAEMNRRLVSIHTTFVALGVALETELHRNIVFDTSTISRVYIILQNFFGANQAALQAVFNQLACVVGRISNFGNVPRTGAVPTWQAYFKYCIMEHEGLPLPATTATLAAAPHWYASAGVLWDNQMFSLKRAMWFIAERGVNPFVVMPTGAWCPPMPGNVLPGIALPAPNPDRFVQGGGGIDMEKINTVVGTFPISSSEREEAKALYDYYMSVPDTIKYKASCSTLIEPALKSAITASTASDYARELLNVFELLQIDAYESNMAVEYEILMSDVNVMIELLDEGLTPAELMEQFFYLVFIHPVSSSLMEGLSPMALKNLLKSISTLGTFVEIPESVSEFIKAPVSTASVEEPSGDPNRFTENSGDPVLAGGARRNRNHKRNYNRKSRKSNNRGAARRKRTIRKRK